MVLMPRVEDAAQVGLLVRTDEGGAVHDRGDGFEPLGESDAVELRIDGGEAALDLGDGEAGLETLTPMAQRAAVLIYRLTR